MTGPVAQDELAALIAGGEDSFTEFKEDQVSNSSLVKELCGFINTQGGRIIIGVADDSTAVGTTAWDDERVMNVVRTSIDPPTIPTFQRVAWENGITLVVVGVSMGPEKPYAVRSNESRRYYIRAGTTTREASREELLRLSQSSGTIASDLRPVLSATIEDLDEAALTKHFAGRRSLQYENLAPDARRDVLVAAEVLSKDEHQPTVGGLLCFGRDPQRHIDYASITCAAYPGPSLSREMTDRKDVRGPIARQIEDATRFIEQNVRSPSSVSGLERQDAPRYSREGLRELIANAVAHRSYFITGPIQLRVFSDRIEVISPGAPPNGVTPTSMRVGVSVRRNQFIVAHLVEQSLVDAAGRGVVLLFEEAAELGLPAPRIEVDDAWTKVTLSWDTSVQGTHPT